MAKNKSYVCQVQSASKSKGQPAVFLVFDHEPEGEDQPIGALEKYPDTRTEFHPYKAFLGVGVNRRYLGSFYPDRFVENPGVQIGGKRAAVQAVLNAAVNKF